MTEQLVADALASIAGLAFEVRVCDHHETWDEMLEPTGDACGAPAEFLIVWTESRQVSFACALHIDIDSRAQAHVVSKLEDE